MSNMYRIGAAGAHRPAALERRERMRTTQNVDRLSRIIRNTRAQILIAEQTKNYDRAYKLAMNAVDETGRMLNALANYAQAKAENRAHAAA